MDNKDLKTVLVGEKSKLRLKLIAKGLKVDKVFGNRILVYLVKPHTQLDEFVKGGLVLPEGSKEAHTPLPSTGIVVMVGADMQWMGDFNIMEGDMLMFSKYSGTDFRVDEQDFRILDVNEVLCRLISADGSEVVEEELG